MKILQYIYIVGIGILLLAQGRAQTAMGTWRDHFSYNKAIQVLEAGNRIYAATEDALIFFDKADIIAHAIATPAEGPSFFCTKFIK